MGDGDEFPQNLEWGLLQIVPPYYVMFQNFKHQIACITMAGRGTPPHTPISSHQAFWIHPVPPRIPARFVHGCESVNMGYEYVTERSPKIIPAADEVLIR